MQILFELTMPNVGSWNGKWTGADKKYFKVYSASKAQAEKILGLEGAPKNYHYSFGDGWSANVRAEAISSKQKHRFLKQSAGFCGYEWMIDSIFNNGKILV